MKVTHTAVKVFAATLILSSVYSFIFSTPWATFSLPHFVAGIVFLAAGIVLFRYSNALCATPRRRKTSIAVAASLLLYILSSGPAARLMWNEIDSPSETVFETAYAPVIWLQNYTILSHPLFVYFDLCGGLDWR